MAQEPWRPLLFWRIACLAGQPLCSPSRSCQDHSGVCGPASGLLAHGAGALAATAVLPGNCGPASGLLARGAGALAATASLPGNCGPASGLLAHGAGALAAIPTPARSPGALLCALFPMCEQATIFLRRRCIKITSGLMLAIVVHSTLSDVECFQPVQQASFCARLLIHFAIQELR